MVTNRYAEADDLRASLSQNSTADDTVLEFLLDTASSFIDHHCNRKEYGFLALKTATALEFPGNGQRYIYIPECMAITVVKVKEDPTGTFETTIAAGEYRGFRGSPKRTTSIKYGRTPFHGVILLPGGSKASFIDGRYRARPGFKPIDDDIEVVYFPTVEVTARWGYADAIPNQIRTATIMQAMRWYKRMAGGMGDALASPDLGQMQFVKKLDPDIDAILHMTGLVRPHIIGGK